MCPHERVLKKRNNSYEVCVDNPNEQNCREDEKCALPVRRIVIGIVHRQDSLYDSTGDEGS